MINDPSRNSKYSGTFCAQKSLRNQNCRKGAEEDVGIRLSSSALCGGFFTHICCNNIGKMMMRGEEPWMF